MEVLFFIIIFVIEIITITIMGRLNNILDNYEYSFEMSNKVKENKMKLVDKLYDLFDFS